MLLCILVIYYTNKKSLNQLNKANTSDTKTALFRLYGGVELLPALHYSVDFIFLSFGIMGFNVDL